MDVEESLESAAALSLYWHKNSITKAMKNCLALLLICFCIGCADNSTEPTDTSVTDQPDTTQVAGASGCYRLIVKRDTMVVTLQQQGNAITGSMVFDNYQKDGSKGTIQGTIEGDIIKVWYDFQSEGMRSYMEVYFKLQQESLIRGLGTVATRGDTSFYSNPADIRFTEEMVYQKISCDSIEAHHR